MAVPFVGYENIIYLLESKDIGTTITASSYMKLGSAHKAGFLICFGAVTSASADTENITVEAATAEGGTEAQIDFYYRLSGALGTNTWGAITSASSLSIDPATQDNVMVWIEIDPAELASNDYNFVRVRLTDNTDMTACLVSVIGFLNTRYKQTTFVSATASASA